MDDIDKKKAIGQFQLQLNGIFSAFGQYGMWVYIPEAVKAIVDLALKLHERLNGADIPVHTDFRHRA